MNARDAVLRLVQLCVAEKPHHVRALPPYVEPLYQVPAAIVDTPEGIDSSADRAEAEWVGVAPVSSYIPFLRLGSVDRCRLLEV